MSGLRREKNFSLFTIAAILISVLLPTSSAQSATPTSLVTCINIDTRVERISSTGTCFDLKEAPVRWRANTVDGQLTGDAEYKTITVCSSANNSKFKYRVLRPKCGKYQETSTYIRTVAKPAQPIVGASLSDGESQIAFKLENNPNTNLDAPIAFYTITLSDGTSRRVSSQKALNLAVQNLKENTSYSFTVSATSADGTSKVSVATAPVKTPVRVAPPVRTREDVGTTSIPSAPSITLSAVAETVSANTTATGFTVNSTGGAVASYSISPSAPTGMSFNTSTGAFTGTPTTNAIATTFTVTATNAGGSATATFVLTVSAPVPDTVISVAAIGGVTRPVTGATPVSAVTSANGYTGTVSWSGSPTTFAVGTIYTATITLTAASGFTLTGVTANFFTVTGATSVTHSADSGVITAVFPATVAGTATKAVMHIQPSGAVNGLVFTAQPVVRVTDSAGNTVTTYTGNVVAAKVSGVGTLYGTQTVAAVAGVATFTNLYLLGAIGNSFLKFTPTSLTAANADTLTVTIGAASKLGISRAAPSISASGATFSTQPQISVQDVGGNTITNSSSVVTATVSAGGTILGIDTATAVSGVATFVNIGLSGTGGSSYTVTYTVSGLTVITASTYLPRFCDGTSYNCQIGDTGPGGGKIFYVNLGGFTCGVPRNVTCRYLEAAPSNWNGSSDPTRPWAQSAFQSLAVANVTSPETATAVAIGWGQWNTQAIILQGNSDSSTVAAALTGSYASTPFGTLVDDWFLPSRDELWELVRSAQYLGMLQVTYWSSSEGSASRAGNYGINASWGASAGDNSKNTARYVRAIRTF